MASLVPLDPVTIQKLQDAGLPAVDFTVGTTVSLLSVFTLLLYLFLIADGVAAVGMILYALGIRAAAGDSQPRLDLAKKIISGTLFALVGSYALVLLALTVNPDLVKGTVDFSSVSSSAAKTGNAAFDSCVAGNGGVGECKKLNPPETPTVTNTNTGNAAEDAVRQRLYKEGIQINRNPCVTTGATGCTNVAGMREETISMLISLKKACFLSNINCNVIITGGTEAGHQTHGVGKFPIDLRITNDGAVLYDFVKNNASQTIGETDWCFKQYVWGGFKFCDEKKTDRHYHVYR